VVSESFLTVTRVFVVHEGIASFEGQFSDVAKLSELVHEVLAADVARKLAYVKLCLARCRVIRGRVGS